MQLELELWKFHDIFFEEGSHSYTDSLGTKYTSVTSFVHQFSPPQDWDAIARRYALKHDFGGLSAKAAQDPGKRDALEKEAAAAVRAMWAEAGEHACTLGTHVHAYMENQWKRKLYTPSAGCEGYAELSAAGLRAYQELSKRFVPIREEFIVYKASWGLCGTIDFLAYDTLKDRAVILDYKTNKEIKRENPFQKCVGALEGLPDCNYVHYCAQLSTYKAILESETSVRIGGMALVHIRKDGYSVIPCADYSDLLRRYLDGRIEER